MANTFVKIVSVTVGSGGAANIDFTSIPATFTDLKLVLSTRTDYAASQNNCSIALNGSTSNFSQRLLEADGATAVSASRTDNLNSFLSTGSTDTSGIFGNAEFFFANYTSANYKSISVDDVEETNGTTAYASLRALLWSNTAAINQITLTPQNSANFVQYSTATLYGIKKN